MKKWLIYATYSASKFIGEYEAETEEEARAKAEEDAPPNVCLCHHCSGEIDIGDVIDLIVDETQG